MTTEAVLRTESLTKHYGRVRAVDGLDLEVRRGEIYGFLGRNGAGKTTTIRMLLGLIRPTSGTVQVFGHPIGYDQRWLRRVGFLVESATAYPNLTVAENLDIHRRLTGAARSSVAEAIGRLRLDDYADRRAGRFRLMTADGSGLRARRSRGRGRGRSAAHARGAQAAGEGADPHRFRVRAPRHHRVAAGRLEEVPHLLLEDVRLHVEAGALLGLQLGVLRGVALHRLDVHVQLVVEAAL